MFLLTRAALMGRFNGKGGEQEIWVCLPSEALAETASDVRMTRLLMQLLPFVLPSP